MGRSTDSAEHWIEWKDFSHYKSFLNYFFVLLKMRETTLYLRKKKNDNVVLCWKKILLQGLNDQTLRIIHLRDQASQIKDSRHILVNAKLRLRQQMLPLNRA